MKRRWKILIAVLAGVALLAVLNAFAADRETEPAAVTVDGAEVLNLPGGELQVLDLPARELESEAESDEGESSGGEGAATRGGGAGTGAAGRNRAGAVERLPPPPIVLIHGYTGSLVWWEEVAEHLSESHRVVAIDLLGHGGSAKPSSGYTVENQADLVARALNELGVEGAVVVGHSLGGTIATSLAERSSELVQRLVIVDTAPDLEEYGDLDLMARVSRMPVIGQALQRIAPDTLVRNGLEQGFAPGFEVPDFAVEDLRRMTFTAFREWPEASEAYTSEQPLDERIEASFMPLLVVFGAEDQIFDARESVSAYAAVPAARTELIEDAGHSPMVEAPEETAALIEEFAAPPPAPPAERRERGGATRRGEQRRSGSARQGRGRERGGAGRRGSAGRRGQGRAGAERHGAARQRRREARHRRRRGSRPNERRRPPIRPRTEPRRDG